jgi:hypothetical protein
VTVGRRRLGAATAALAAVAGVATALAFWRADTVQAVDPPPQTMLAPPPAFPADNPPPPEQPLEPGVTNDLVASFSELAQTAGATIGVAVVPVGSGESALVLGDWTVGPAWSTIKVPLAIAALRETPSLTDAASAAITRSDNAAAEELWASLGEPETAAEKVEAVLREAGDRTQVESRRLRPEFSAFGQTQWPLAEQARFLASAVCDDGNQAVVDLMGQVAGDQQWGIGNLPDTEFKGGWGPSTSGEYLVRQFGTVATPSGESAVAIAASPASGGFADGVNVLNSVAEWLAAHSAELPSGNCGN